MSDVVKMVMVSYNSAIDREVIEALEKCRIENYTRWTKVQGKGKASGCHFGSEVWPGENSVIFSAMEDEKAKELLKRVKDLRAKLGKIGIKAFAWQLDDITQ